MTHSLPPGPKAALARRRAELLGPAYRLFYDEPLDPVRGEGAWLWDARGRRYLDAYNNVPHVGHCHPRVVEAIRAQAAKLNTHTRYLHETVIALSERLTALTPDGLDQVMFACSGTEANDLALRVARAATGHAGVIVTEHAYHGHSSAVVRFSTEDTPPERRGDHVVTVPAPNLYRCPVPSARAAAYYAREMDRAIEALAARGHRPAAFYLDSLLSSEGVPTVPDGWLGAAVARVQAAGGLFVADEVQAGYGRSGTHFWGFERLGATPDLVTLGKPMGNGHPVSALIARPDLLARFSEEHHYFNTFGGNPVSCAAALAVLEVMEEEELQKRARGVGDRLQAGLASLAGHCDAIGDVRGAGLYLGVELVQERVDKTPHPDLARRAMNDLRRAGVLVGVTGPADNVIKIRPPLVFNEEQADLLVTALGEALGAASSGRPA